MTHGPLILGLAEDTFATFCEWQRAAAPIEVCALCAVDAHGRQHLIRLTNHAGLAGAFEVSRAEERVARAAAVERGWRIVAFVHAHPDHGPEMSVRDAISFDRDTLPWIIVGGAASGPRQQTYLPRDQPADLTGAG
jgi:proteasome lid subunit RPN8/RPN11